MKKVMRNSKSVCAGLKKSRHKLFCLSILSLSLLGFQLPWGQAPEAFAAQKLPVLRMETLEKKPFQAVFKTLESSGYHPRAVQESDLLFSITPQNAPYLLLPLGHSLNDTTLSILDRYLYQGGQLILLPTEPFFRDSVDPSVQQLFRLLNFSVTGIDHLITPKNFNWKGLVRPGTMQLQKDSHVLAISPSPTLNILATWGQEYPAVVMNAKGAVLNWQWDQPNSEATNAIALAKVMPLSMPDSVALEKPSAFADSALSKPKRFLSQRDGNQSEVEHFPAVVTPNPALPIAERIGSLEPKTDFNPAMSTLPAQKTEQSLAQPHQVEATAMRSSNGSASMSTAQNHSKPLVSENAPHQTLNPLKKSAKPESRAAQLTKNKAEADASEAETLSNILGGTAPQHEKSSLSGKNTSEQDAIPFPDDPLLKEKMSAVISSEGSGLNANEHSPEQKRFSFLDADASSVLTPEFDYGVYSMNLRMLDDYQKRIKDALETSRQLSLEMPEDKVNNLLKEANTYKKKFEALYPGNQTQAGLEAFAQARKITLQALAMTTLSPQVEARALWLDRSAIVEAGNPAEFKKRIQKFHQAGINIIYLETLNAGFPIYPSAILRNNPMVQGWDPLKVAVEEGHRLGMEVHAWVWAFAVGNRRHNPLINQPADYPGPILSQPALGSEALRNREGGLMVDGRQNEFWLSPASPKGRKFLLSVYQEIVNRYDVDGLQLDYIRYPFQTSSTRMGFEPTGKERFFQLTGLSLDNLDEQGSRAWIAWKTQQVSSFVQEVSSTLKKINPRLKLSAAVFPMKRDARIVAIQQDWETWIDNGWIDTLSPMSYTTSPERLQGMFDYVQGSSHKRSLIYPGIALHRLDGGQLVFHIDALRQKGSLGSTLFAGTHLDSEKSESLGKGPFKMTSSLTPHRDVVKAIKTILEDYQNKFDTLVSKGALPTLSSAQIQAINTAMDQLAGGLNAIGTGHEIADIALIKIQPLQQQFKNLLAASRSWSEADKLAHPFRAQYFETDILLIDELLSYLSGKAEVAHSAPTRTETSASNAPAEKTRASGQNLKSSLEQPPTAR